jgi:hypothetical protein
VSSRAIIALTLLMLLTACSSGKDDPETVLRAVIAAGEQAVEAHDLSDAMALVDQTYSDDHGNGRPQLRGRLAGYFLRHPSITIISKIDRIKLLGDDQAKVLLYAGLAGSAAEAAAPLSGWRANLLRFELSFRLDQADEWRLTHAAWRQATREDFIQ